VTPPWDWQLPAELAPPPVPPDNPMTAAKVALGRRLFYEPRLSLNGSQSCASCHFQRNGFAAPVAHPIGSTGETLAHNAPGLANVAYYRAYTWASHLLTTLERQIVVPMFADSPVELGLSGNEHVAYERLAAQPRYQLWFAAAFPGEDAPINTRNVVRALACFVRSLTSTDAPYDRYLRGDRGALSPAATRGLALFFGDRLGCAGCHSGRNLSAAAPVGGEPRAAMFFATGMADDSDTGLFALTRKPADKGRFRVPSLCNVAVTAPYFHDGSAATLAEAIGRYEHRTGAARDPRLRQFTLSDGERRDLIAFLQSLTDTTFLTNPRLSDPFAH